jgi:hypothetical protein
MASAGDIFLLATDGLTKLVKEQRLREITSSASSLEKACEALIARFGEERPKAVHPRFGRLTTREWGILLAKHLEHHFGQFGG